MNGKAVIDCPTDGQDEEASAGEGAVAVVEMKPDGPLVSVDRAGELIGGICGREVYRMLNRGLFDSVNIGRRRMVVTASVMAYAEQLIAGEPDPSPVPRPQPAPPGPRPPSRPPTPKPPRSE